MAACFAPHAWDRARHLRHLAASRLAWGAALLACATTATAATPLRWHVGNGGWVTTDTCEGCPPTEVRSAADLAAATKGPPDKPRTVRIDARNLCALAPALAPFHGSLALKLVGAGVGTPGLDPAVAKCVVALAPAAIAFDLHNSAKLSAGETELLAHLAFAEAVRIAGANDAIVAAVMQAAHPNLQAFAVDELARVTYATAGSLAGVPGLRSLTLANDGITDVGVAKLGALAALEELDLSSTRVTGAGLARLGGLKVLRKLSLGYVALDNAGMATLVRVLPQLQVLDLNMAHVTDSCLAPLAKLPALHTLVLDGTEISNAALPHLAKFPALAFLDVSDTGVTEKVVAAWAAAHPRIRTRYTSADTGAGDDGD